MEQTPAPSDLAAINEKLDALATRVAYLTEQAELAARRQEARAELMHDAIPLANQAVEVVTTQLEEVQDYVDLDDLLRLLKRLLRNGRNLDLLLNQLESMMDLAQTIGPLSNSAFEKTTTLLETAERKGYFALVRGGAQVADSIAGSFTEEDIKQIGVNLALVLRALEGLAEPAGGSLRALFHEMRDADTRRGLAVVLRALRVIGAEAAR
jgi:uncharacterized protein YjgD (DUF1641 family)